ncbi:MAG: TRAP transporter permease [Spirochaetaceae bacterium]|jgi:TRAP transporter 4TM/12TM fusion protein|nr:TRAP transporter permease [Spirochaetaceae bacterium]
MTHHEKHDHVLNEQETEELIAQFDRESNVRKFTGTRDLIVKCLLLIFTAYVLWVTLFISLPEQVRRSAFLGILIFIGYILYPIHRGGTKRINYVPWYDLVLGTIGTLAFFYYVVNFKTIVARAVMLQGIDIAIGVIGIIILAELCRRVVGMPILVVATGFITYAFASGFSMRRVIHQLFYTTDGIIGTPIGVCSTFIVLFIFLASFLEKSGIATFFIDLANSVAGFASGGPAKVAVIASALEGMYSGSSVANTVGSGSVTIPVMKKIGYKPEFAAAVEAAASTGGQIMPPIMGAAAFLMAELTGISYPVIAVSAILPAVLYFTGIFLMIHFEAKKLGLKGLPKESIPHFGRLLLTKGYLFLPVIVLVALMSFGFTPAYAACFAILTAIVVSMFRKETRFTFQSFIEALAAGSRNTIGVALACAMAGIVVGIVSLTGLGQTLIGMLTHIVNIPFFTLTHTNLLVALVITMISCLILGMGIPTTANYIIMATITAPMVIRAGQEAGITVPLLAAHMFVFYFGIVADITPPVALAAYAGAAIAKSNPIKTGVTATRLAITAFLIPYIFIFSPSMLLIDTSPFQVIQIVITSCIGMFGLSAGLEGYMFKKVPLLERLMAITGGFLLIYPGLITDLLGFSLIAVVIALQLIKKNPKSVLKLKS